MTWLGRMFGMQAASSWPCTQTTLFIFNNYTHTSNNPFFLVHYTNCSRPTKGVSKTLFLLLIPVPAIKNAFNGSMVAECRSWVLLATKGPLFSWLLPLDRSPFLPGFAKELQWPWLTYLMITFDTLFLYFFLSWSLVPLKSLEVFKVWRLS